MWSLFSRDPLKDFGYEIEENILYKSKSSWELHDGTKKQTQEKVSVFVCEGTPNDLKLTCAKAAIKRLKTLRHPSILKYIDSLETEKTVYLVTEYVSPLNGYFESNSNYTDEQKTFATSWGLHQISKGIWFLVNDCNLFHNNVCLDSVFVSRSGEWQLGGMEYVCPASETPPSKPSLLDVYRVPEHGKNTSGQKWSYDSWGLGCLIWEIFNGPLSSAASLKTLGKIPKSLSPFYCELVAANPAKRLGPGDFITKCRNGSGYMKNRFVDSMIFLEEIQVKDSNETAQFFASISNLLDSFPNDICKYKILPQLINAFEFGNAGSSILNPIFKIGKLLESDEYQKKIVPCIVKLFSSKDRSTRAKLLQQMELFIQHCEPPLVNDQIFPQVAQGFLDTNPVIREETIKCMLHMAPKLNHHNLNEEVMKHFSRLQVKDDQGGIRTNVTVCLGKISSYLHPQVRQKVLITAFARAMRDPFPPSRIAGVIALSSTISFYTIQDYAKKILPTLCQSMVDSDKGVRDQAFRVSKVFLNKLEKVSEDPSLSEEMEASVNSGSAGSIATSFAGWAVTNLTSKFYKSSKSKTSPDKESAKTEPDNSNLPEKEVTINQEGSSSSLSQNVSPLEENQWDEPDWNEGTEITNDAGNAEGWDKGDDWADFDTQGDTSNIFKPEPPQNDFIIPQAKASPPQPTKSSNSDWGDAWEDPMNADEKKVERERRLEAKRLENQRKMEERKAARQSAQKGPMKLGAKKV